jgi:hypothetical protein
VKFVGGLTISFSAFRSSFAAPFGHPVAESAADASFNVYDGYAILFGDGVHLAPFSACSAAYAFIWVNDGIVVGVGHGVLDAPFVDPSEYAAAAAATVAYVADSFHDIAYRVD